MKIIRVVVILLVITALVSLGAYLYTKRNSPASSTNSPAPSISPLSGQQNPSAGGVVFSNAAPAREIVIEASEYKFTPSTITIKEGESVKITMKNAGAMPHNWVVENMGGASIDLTNPGSSNSIVMTASQKGTFTTYCAIGSHRKLGMEGKLIVQ
jgi:plastocyanin